MARKRKRIIRRIRGGRWVVLEQRKSSGFGKWRIIANVKTKKEAQKIARRGKR